MKHTSITMHRGWTRRQVLITSSALAGSLLAGCQPGGPEPRQPVTTATAVMATTAPSTPTLLLEEAPTEDTIDLRRKLAQMVLVGFRGLSLDENNPIVIDIHNRNIGGVVLFSYDVALQQWNRNIESSAQVAALNASLQDLAATPLIIAVDQEGGRVARLNERFGFPPTLSAQELGERNDPAFTYEAAAQMARTLKAVGVNHTFAPVVDLNTNPDNPIIGAIGRSFSADPSVVIEQAAAFIRAHRDHGVTTTLKHFPGHGSSRDDSHLGFVEVTDVWQPVELEPYRQLIARNLVDAVMTAHVFNAQLDPDSVATLSQPIITGILREELGFDGVVFSDDMQMGAIADNYGFEDAVVRTVEAGVDVIAIANNLVFDPEIATRIIELLAAAVADGRLSEARIDASCRRIMALKAKWMQRQV
ncbi:MAG: glycoside hydrolase family 3 protein [Caldilinea sp.]